MTDEERRRLAQEKVEKLRKATKTRTRADRMDWKPKALIWIHPMSDIVERRRVWFAKEVEDREDDEKKKRKSKSKKPKKRIVTVPYIVSDDPECDPFYLLRKALKADEEIDAEEVVLVVGSGAGKVEYRKGDVLGWDDFSFKRSLVPQQDFVCVAIMDQDSSGKRPDKPKAEIFAGAKTLGREIRKEIDAEMDENGEDRGNPFMNPYPFRIEYDETASGTDMYSARARPSRKADATIQALLDGECPDLDDETKVDDSEAIYEILKAALVVDLEIPEPKDATFKDPKDGDEVEEPVDPDEGKTDDPAEPELAEDGGKTPENEVDRLERELAELKAKRAAAEKKAAEKKAAEKKKAADKKAEEKKAEEKKTEEKKAEDKKAEDKKADKPKRASRKAVKKDPPPKDEVVVPEGYEDPGPRPDDENVGWWPDREKGERYDICPRCERPVREDDTECPHRDCDTKYTTASDEF